MSYAELEDLQARFGDAELVQLTDVTGSGEIDIAPIERALDDATAEIDGYLSARYQLPLASVPVVLVRLCADMARYYLHDDHAPDQITERHKAAVQTLQRISKGEVSLGMDAAGESPQTADGAEMVSGGRVWAREDSKGYI
ncbi:DUF1320 domain-containing protein [Natronospirillum operosum]|uniref:DUF1320 domain-containing protein n=1 Tax=Natronospirillum operosum TaxID=2759953 RepID=A0A4Z0W4T1_9GAMM|nr:phage protein Gp36 family protein [Natronospirillum operosum]TGG92527.1 DUF1320 domain-containing protein [Natronospirillum operosum]